jgi:hypothetical protein
MGNPSAIPRFCANAAESEAYSISVKEISPTSDARGCSTPDVKVPVIFRDAAREPRLGVGTASTAIRGTNIAASPSASRAPTRDVLGSRKRNT